MCKLCIALGTFEVDHVIPVSQFLSGQQQELQALCLECHRTKTSLEGNHCTNLESRFSRYDYLNYAASPRLPPLAELAKSSHFKWSLDATAHVDQRGRLQLAFCRENSLGSHLCEHQDRLLVMQHVAKKCRPAVKQLLAPGRHPSRHGGAESKGESLLLTGFQARRRFPRQGSPTVNLVISRAKGLQINERENRRLMQVSSDPAARCRREPEGGVVRLESGQTFAGPELLKHTASVQGLICGDGSALATPRFLTSQGAQRLRNPRNLAQPGFKPIDSHEWKFYVEGTNVWKQNYKTGRKARKREEEKAAAEERQEKKANEEKAAAQAVAKEEKAKKAAVEEQRQNCEKKEGKKAGHCGHYAVTTDSFFGPGFKPKEMFGMRKESTGMGEGELKVKLKMGADFVGTTGLLKFQKSKLMHGSAEQARLGTQGYELLVHEIVDVLIKPKTVTIDQQMEANVVTKCGTEQRAARHIIISTVQPRDSVASYQAVPLVPLNAKALVDIYGTYLTSEISPGQGALGAAIPRSMQSNLASTVQSALGLTNTLNICHAGLWTRIWLNLLSTEFAARAAGSEVQWVAPGADMVWNGSVGSGGKSYLMYDTLAQQGRVVFLEMQLEELQDLAPAIRMLLSSYPVFQVRYSVDMQNDLCDASSMQDQPMFEPDGDYTDVNGDMDFMPMAEMFRFEYPGQVVVLTEREEALRAGDLPLGFTEMGALGAPVNGAQPGTLVPAGAFLTGGPYSAERVQRAVTLLANALPDAGGCSSGFLNAVSRLCSPCWMGVYGSESLDQSAAVTATGKVLFPAECSTPKFIESYKKILTTANAYAAEIAWWCNRNPDYIAWSHGNLNVDNVFFWRTAEGALDLGILDWGGASSGSMGWKLWWWLYCCEYDFLNSTLDQLLDTFIAEYQANGGPALDREELRWQFTLSALAQGVGLLGAVPQIYKMCKKTEWPTIKSRKDPRIVNNIDGKNTLRIYIGVKGSGNMIKDWDIERKLDNWTKEVCAAAGIPQKEIVVPV
ncbi:hypothetical protein AK812_SmicGene22162 [Symbiodinium microadriaticum]|uniref:HNH domain-containing protein n=1 Tax=Symbiodinium microadriaticum TaxID=2951 RepID=A0A1Q9DKI3_SYMMI|nr:hypothetical protein AK812_SmicGene22162 [Symbiodinium microadriaticum]